MCIFAECFKIRRKCTLICVIHSRTVHSPTIQECIAHMCICAHVQSALRFSASGYLHVYGVATISRLLKIIGLFCRIYSFFMGLFCKREI